MAATSFAAQPVICAHEKPTSYFPSTCVASAEFGSAGAGRKLARRASAPGFGVDAAAIDSSREHCGIHSTIRRKQIAQSSSPISSIPPRAHGTSARTRVSPGLCPASSRVVAGGSFDRLWLRRGARGLSLRRPYLRGTRGRGSDRRRPLRADRRRDRRGLLAGPQPQLPRLGRRSRTEAPQTRPPPDRAGRGSVLSSGFAYSNHRNSDRGDRVKPESQRTRSTAAENAEGGPSQPGTSTKRRRQT
jgi:hypothetical protein